MARFDYVFSDSMTWTDNRGKRMRTWLPDEVGTIPDAEEFMDTLVDRTVGILEHEPIDIYANPTYLPDQLAKDYERLWTEARRKRVIEAAVRNNVAIELNNRYKLPSASLSRMAKAAGCKFSFGSNNSGPGESDPVRARAENDRRVQAGVAGFLRAGPMGAAGHRPQGRRSQRVMVKGRIAGAPSPEEMGDTCRNQPIARGYLPSPWIWKERKPRPNIEPTRRFSMRCNSGRKISACQVATG